MNTRESDAENAHKEGNVNVNPSERQPLVPLDVGINKKEEECKPIVHIDHVDLNDDDASWLSKNLCGVSTNSTFESIEQLNEKPDDSHANRNLVLDETEGPFSVEAVPYSSFSGPVERTIGEDNDSPKHEISTLKDNSDIEECSEKSQASLSSHIKLEVLTSIDDFLRHNRILCSDWRGWYDDLENEI